MKYALTLLAATLLLSQSCTPSKTAGTAYTLTGKIDGIPDGMVKLQYNDPSTRESITIDSAQVQGGTFTLKGNLSQPEMMTISISPDNWSASLFMEPGDIHIEGDTTKAERYDYSDYGAGKGVILANYTVTGSKNQDAYKAFENHPKSLAAKNTYTQLNERYQAATDDQQREAINGEREKFSEGHKIWELQWIDSMTNAQPSLVAGAYLLSNYHNFNESMPVQELDKRLLVFQSPAKESSYVKELQEKVARKIALLPGKIAPDFKALKPDSSEFSLSSLRGKYVLLDFWASWCAPCRKAIPHWKEVYSQYHDKGLEIVGVTNDSKWPDWFKALEQEKMPWLQVADDFPVKNFPARIATQYDIPSLPSYVLLDKEGKILVHTTSKEEVDSKLKEFFN
ncbi:MAG: AhpC/TSA family protein [Sphingobacterium sp.]|jgi:thiol-disulfide isomerase/thioredoxin|nr:AhpC/TSA family protein [Sphingobacterium sp.]